MKSFRVQRNWTQADLARHARVSLRTINRIEAAEGPISIRPDAIARIAEGIDYPVVDALALLGIKVPSEKLKQLTENSSSLGEPLAHAQRKKPSELLENVLSEMKDRTGPALLCFSVTSDRSIENTGTVDVMCRLLKAGLWIAVTSPYPNSNYASEGVPKIPNLARTYNSVFSRVRGIAKQLKAFVPGCEHQIAVMRLNGQPDDAMQSVFRLASPNLAVTDNRPCLFYFPVVKDKGLPSKVKLALYLRYGGIRKDQWLEIYPSEGSLDEQERAADVRDNWTDYFGDIITAWEDGIAAKSWKLQRGDKNHWYRFDSDESHTVSIPGKPKA